MDLSEWLTKTMIEKWSSYEECEHLLDVVLRSRRNRFDHL